jgi:hypothetical protein
MGAVAEYERLRRGGSAEGGGPFRWGRALLMHRGVAAWLEALASLNPVSRPQRPAETPEEAPGMTEISMSSTLAHEAVGIVSEMVFSCWKN